MLEVQTEAFMLGPAAKSSGWNHLPAPDYGIHYFWKERSVKEKDGGRKVKGKKAIILCQNCIHLRTWHTSAGKCMDRMTFKCSCVYMHVLKTEERRRGCRKDEVVLQAEKKKENKIIGGWNWFSLNKKVFISISLLPILYSLQWGLSFFLF